MILDPDNQDVDKIRMQLLLNCRPPSTWKLVCFDQDPTHINNFKGIYSNVFKNCKCLFDFAA